MGTKKMFLVLSRRPIFCAEPDRASLVETAMSTGRALRRCALTESVTGVSVMPHASLPRVLPVQGATTIISNSFLGPIGSACDSSCIISFSQISVIFRFISSLFPNLVSVEKAVFDIMGKISCPSSLSCRKTGKTFSKVQNEPQIPNPILRLRIFLHLRKLFKSGVDKNFGGSLGRCFCGKRKGRNCGYALSFRRLKIHPSGR